MNRLIRDIYLYVINRDGLVANLFVDPANERAWHVDSKIFTDVPLKDYWK